MAKKKLGKKVSKSPNVSRSPQAKPRQSSQTVQRSSYERQTSPYKSAQDPKTKKAVNGAAGAQHRTKAPKRRKFRGGNYSLYYILGGFVALIVFIILANTVLFNCTSINVSGNVRYTEQEIADMSGIQMGENLLRINVSSAKDRIVSGLVYVDAAEVKKSFPTQINITITEAEKRYCVTESGITAAISQNGKIIEHCAADGLTVVRGYDAETMELGAWLASKTSGKSDIPDKIFKAAEKTGLADLTVIDMTDKFGVTVTVENRVILELGMADDLEQKFAVAVKLLESEIGKDERVTINLTNPEVVPVRNTAHTTSSAAASSSVTSGTSSEPENSTASDTEDPGAESDPETSSEPPAE